MLHDTNYSNLSLEGIAYNIGFRSRTTFINVFKKIYGITPSEYKSQIVFNKHVVV